MSFAWLGDPPCFCTNSSTVCKDWAWYSYNPSICKAVAAQDQPELQKKNLSQNKQRKSQNQANKGYTELNEMS